MKLSWASLVRDIDLAATEIVVKKFKRTPLHPLENSGAPERPGVYALYHERKVIYVGKVCGRQRGLRSRLLEHSSKLASIDVQAMCRWLPLESGWVISAAESALIKQHGPVLNGSGFGTRTPRVVDGLSNWENLIRK